MGTLSVALAAYTTVSVASPELNFNFCEIDNLTYDTDTPVDQIWSLPKVQQEVYAAAQNVRESVTSSYIASYIPMTWEHDIERCGGVLSPQSPEASLIGDRLADIMTRYHVALTTQCLNSDPSVQGAAFCDDFDALVERGLDGLTSSLWLTATYLSSHMAESLAALMFDDVFWDAFPDLATHRGAGPDTAVLTTRLEWTENYKSTYDLNNVFLANRVGVITQALSQGCYADGGALPLAAAISDVLPGLPLLVKGVRDRTFQTAMLVAQFIQFNPSMHPMLSTAEGKHRISFGRYKPWLREPSALQSLRTRARALFVPPGAFIAFDLVGGLSPWEYALRLAFDRRCRLPAPAY